MDKSLRDDEILSIGNDEVDSIADQQRGVRSTPARSGVQWQDDADRAMFADSEQEGVRPFLSLQATIRLLDGSR